MFVHIVGTRPNFMKACPLIKKMEEEGMQQKIIHTGQHYNYNMNKVFFDELDIPDPDYNLNVTRTSHAEQTADVMVGCEEIFKNIDIKVVIVYGDVNSTLAAALTASKLHIPIVHIEAGSRSFDKKMPEEVNRILVDHISDYLFCIDSYAVQNLMDEGIEDKVYLTGNLMIDTLKSLKLTKEYDDFVLLTLHRPSNVDGDKLFEILDDIEALHDRVIFPVHPRLKSKLNNRDFKNIEMVQPMGYKDFVSHLNNCKYAITDSGGIQCEASVLNTPLITLRDTTEHLDTIEHGTNSLCEHSSKIKRCKPKYSDYSPKIWDGKVAERIVEILKEI